jgi:hypothetical protein
MHSKPCVLILFEHGIDTFSELSTAPFIDPTSVNPDVFDTIASRFIACLPNLCVPGRGPIHSRVTILEIDPLAPPLIPGVRKGCIIILGRAVKILFEKIGLTPILPETELLASISLIVF